MARKIILDVDTGHDDAVAIMMAARNPAIELLGITVTAGNQYLDKTLRNTLNLCSALSIDTPVFAGMTKPLLCDLEPASRIHGESGFDGPVFGPCSKAPEPRHAAVFIAETVMAAPPGEITLVAVGPLTNIAMAVSLEPAIASRVAEIVLMGGSIAGGNVTPSAEFNIHTDPESAAIVFGSGAPIVMIGLDVTTKVVLTRERLQYFSSLPGRAVSIFAASMDRYSAACEQYIGESPAMHDPCCIAYVADPTICTTRLFNVEIECSHSFTRGRTVVDTTGVTEKKPNARVALAVDVGRFWEMLEAALRRFIDLPLY